MLGSKKCVDDKELTTNTDKKDTNTKKEEISQDTGDKVILDNNDPIVQKLFNIFAYDCLWFDEKLNTDNSVRLKIAYDNMEIKNVLFRNCTSLGVSGTLEKNDSYYYCGEMTVEMSKIYGDKAAFEKAAALNDTIAVTGQNLKAKYEELFSSSFEYKPELFGYYGHIVEYFDKLNLFVKYGFSAGGFCIPSNQVITLAYKEGDKLFIETDYENGNGKFKVNYEFVLENGSYKFFKVTEVK